MDIKHLIEQAIAAREKAYAPYSDFRVGSAILTEDGTIYGGCNVENASYGAAICAERTAATKAVSEGVKNFKAIAIVGWRDGERKADRGLAYPCGICRQFLNEFAAPDLPVIIARTTEDYMETTLGELLPHSFGPEELDESI